MKFDSKQGQEVRTWILFFVGIGLAITFALNGNPLNPWWTLVIGAFTSTAIIVSAVQSLTGGKKDELSKENESVTRSGNGVNSRVGSEKETSSTLRTKMGSRRFGVIRCFRSNYAASI